ncbi:MAG: hypothetical protein MUF12_03335 [Sediminibacterium sp.]|nr:hypothetical protein [Sediminibacterium sp.]
MKKFEGDGEFHEIENLLKVDSETRRTIFAQLVQEGLIKLKGGYRNIDTLVSFGDGKGNIYTPNIPDKVIYYPYTGQITFKGSSYLKSEKKKEMKSNVNVKTGKNSKINLIVNSPNSKIVDNSKKIVSQTKKIIEKIRTDESLTEVKRNNAIQVFETLIYETKQGRVTQTTWEKVWDIGAKIATIGSSVIALLSLR